ncbi:hypothetical protein M9978_17425 [Sphingomonas sp. MG17]|uniref:Uncharacterized protein n=1 Tax=Sphingomonas tagetis TaxID=2949092 RepID=A0A9X2KM43_9SPHN|nr:hypothetical protein [Sphingomonas tagetis]MCP3732204.1 hypothetical protein [Sphingomonas tagetis]
MSGPKVVRIVTREEILEICQGQLARVDAALAEWTRIGRRNDCIDEDALAAANRRREALAALIAADRFMDLQKQAPVEEDFLRADMQRRLTAVAAEQAAARSKERRGREAAAALLRRLRELQAPLDPGVATALERGDAQALAAGFELLADAVAEKGNDVTRDLAATLRDGSPASTFADYLAAQPAAPVDPAVERIAARLDELDVIGGADTAGPRARLEEAASAAPARRRLLVDGLEVETGRSIAEARMRASLRADLLLVRAELRAVGGAVPEADIVAFDVAALETAIAADRAAIDALRASRAAAARRAAVLEGLAGLGYEVTEGMSTGLADDGRLVLRSAARPDYGVEVSAVAGAERMQMRPVAFEAGGVGPDPGRDRDAETIWCGDVSTLQDALASAGGGLVIERSLPVGATPLKRIAVERKAGAISAADAPALRERTLR